MTLRECYAAMEGDYENVSARLHSDRLIRKFILKFPDDGSYRLLEASLAERNYEEAFRAVHTLKGICQNLGFTRLEGSSSRLTEALRCGYTPQADDLLQEVRRDYEAATLAIRLLAEESGAEPDAK